MLSAGYWTVIVSIVGGVVAILTGLWAVYAKSKGAVFVVLLELVLTAAICAGCWYLLPHNIDQMVKKDYRERVFKEYRKCFDDCQSKCLREAEERLEAEAKGERHDRQGTHRQAGPVPPRPRSSGSE